MAKIDRLSKKEMKSATTHSTHQLRELYIRRAKCVENLNKSYLEADKECGGNLSYERYVKVQLSLKSTLAKINKDIQFYQGGTKQCGQ